VPSPVFSSQSCQPAFSRLLAFSCVIVHMHETLHGFRYSLLNGLYALRGSTLGGITPPLTFHRGKPTTIACWFYMSVKDHKFTMPYGQRPTCKSGSR